MIPTYISGNLVRAILNAVDSTSGGFLIDSDIVTQTPSEHETGGIEIVRARHIRQVKSPDLTLPGRHVGCTRIQIRRAPAGHEQQTGSEARQQQRAGGVVSTGHVVDQRLGRLGGRGHGSGRIRPRVHHLGAGRVQRVAVERHFDAMVERGVGNEALARADAHATIAGVLEGQRGDAGAGFDHEEISFRIELDAARFAQAVGDEVSDVAVGHGGCGIAGAESGRTCCCWAGR